MILVTVSYAFYLIRDHHGLFVEPWVPNPSVEWMSVTTNLANFTGFQDGKSTRLQGQKCTKQQGSFINYFPKI